MTSLQSTAAASERVFEFVDEKEMPSQNQITKKLEKENVTIKDSVVNEIIAHES